MESEKKNIEPIGIIGAMEEEVKSLKAAMRIDETVSVAGMEFCRGTLHERAVVVVQCGIGKVHAALCTHSLIHLFDAKTIINTGVAGSLDASINIGDIVISTDAVQHDFDITQLGFQKGEIPYTGKYAFPASEVLRKAAAKAAAEAAPDMLRGSVHCLP